MRMTQEERRAQTSERLITTGIALIAKHGLASVTTKKIAKKAGITWGAAQYLFGNKVGFLTTLGHRILADLIKQAPVPEHPCPSREAGIEHFTWSVWRSFSSPTYLAWVELVRGSRDERQMREALKTLQNAYIEHFTQLWNGSLPASSRKPGDQFVMHHIILTLSGLASRRIFLHDNIAEGQHIRLLVALAVSLDARGRQQDPDAAAD